jgi:hypothetical protein
MMMQNNRFMRQSIFYIIFWTLITIFFMACITGKLGIQECVAIGYLKKQQRAVVKETHNFEMWTDRMKNREVGLVVGFILTDKDIPEWKLIKKEEEEIAEVGGKRTWYLWKNPKSKEEELISIDIVETNSIQAAHEAIIDYIMSCQRPEFPPGESLGLEIGDVVFGVGEKEMPTGAIFARNNLMISVRSVGMKDVSVKDITLHLDTLIYRKPTLLTLSPEIEIYKPKIKKFVLSDKTGKVGDKIALTIIASDPKGEKLTYKMYSLGGQILKEADKYFYRIEKPGKHKIQIFVINESGLVSSAEVKVEGIEGKGLSNFIPKGVQSKCY